MPFPVSTGNGHTRPIPAIGPQTGSRAHPRKPAKPASPPDFQHQERAASVAGDLAPAWNWPSGKLCCASAEHKFSARQALRSAYRRLHKPALTRNGKTGAAAAPGTRLEPQLAAEALHHLCASPAPARRETQHRCCEALIDPFPLCRLRRVQTGT